MSIIQPIMPLNLFSPIGQTSSIEQNKPIIRDGAQKAGSEFGKFLNEALEKVDTLQKNADVATVGLATGQIQDAHTAMIALEKASLSLALTVEVRNKVIEAYHEINRMQV